ncbi:DivIVA domain-containing protein, partial [Tsukamurella pulmonis]
MKLTPADVRNVAFSKPPIGKRGYNEDEVDQFLDLVETELARLIDENNDLQQRNAELERELGEARAGGGEQPSADSTVAFASPTPNAPAVAEPAPAAAAAAPATTE